MPLPLLIIAGAAVTGTTGVGLGIQGIVKMGKAYNKSKKTRRRNDDNIKVLEEKKQKTCKAMDILGENELRILEKFKHFSDLFEKIHNRPYFENIIIGDVMIPTFSPSEIKDVSIGAGVLIGGITGSALGTVGGFAVSGATTSAVIS